VAPPVSNEQLVKEHKPFTVPTYTSPPFSAAPVVVLNTIVSNVNVSVEPKLSKPPFTFANPLVNEVCWNTESEVTLATDISPPFPEEEEPPERTEVVTDKSPVDPT
jgi:hypothetical protein